MENYIKYIEYIQFDELTNFETYIKKHFNLNVNLIMDKTVKIFYEQSNKDFTSFE